MNPFISILWKKFSPPRNYFMRLSSYILSHHHLKSCKISENFWRRAWKLSACCIEFVWTSHIFFSRIKREHFRFRIFFSSMNEIHGEKNRTHGIVALVWHYIHIKWSMIFGLFVVWNTTMASVKIAPVLIVYLYIFTRFQSSQKSWELVHSKIAT